MILTVTPNADIERTWVVPGVRLGDVFRVEEAVILPSGKGINAARAIHTLGGRVTCAGFVAGHTGHLIESLLAKGGLPACMTWKLGESRLVVAIVDPQGGGDATLISEAGQPATEQDWERLEQDVLAIAWEAQLVCISGGLPAGSPLDRFTRLIERLQKMAVPVWVDTSQAALQAAWVAQPAGLKVNRYEAEMLLGMQLENQEAACHAADRLRQPGVQMACITLGADGAVLSSPAGTWFGQSPRIPLLSSVGSGDAFLGGLLWGLEQDLPVEQALRAALAAGAANGLMLGGGRFRVQDFHRLLPEVEIREIE